MASNQIIMFGSKKNKEQERYYLFAGMGGRNQRRKHYITLACAIVAALIVSAIIVSVMYWFNRPQH